MKTDVENDPCMTLALSCFGNSKYDIKLYQLWDKYLCILMTTNFTSNASYLISFYKQNESNIFGVLNHAIRWK